MDMESREQAIDKIYKRRNRYDIPEYQREEVWGVAEKQLLIDTILRGWKLPKFYFLKTSSTGYEVVDGQQRLAAIFDFLDGELDLSPETSARFAGALVYDDLDDAVSTDTDYLAFQRTVNANVKAGPAHHRRRLTTSLPAKPLPKILPPAPSPAPTLCPSGRTAGPSSARPASSRSSPLPAA